MTMNIVLTEPYTYELSSKKGLIINYTPKNSDGIPFLTIEHARKDCIWIFKDKEIIQDEALELNLVTVDLSKHLSKDLMGAPSICLSLLVPKVLLIKTKDSSASVETYCIKTTRKAATPPETKIGQDDSYEIIELTGTAKSE